MYGTESMKYPSKTKLIEHIEDMNGIRVCPASIEKDLQMLRHDFGLDIQYSKYLNGYYLVDPPTREEFKDQILIYLNIEL